MQWIRLLLALMVAGLAFAPAPASAARADGWPVPTCVAAGGGSPGEALARPERFDCARPQSAWGPGDFWVISRPIPASLSDAPLKLRMVQFWNKRTSLWAQYGDGRIVTVPLRRSGPAVTSSGFTLPHRAAPLTRLLWRVEGAGNLRGMVMARLLDAEVSARYTTGVAILNAGFIGLCLGLLACNLALWAALRHRFQLAYCVMLASLTFYAAVTWGAFQPLLPPSQPQLGQRLLHFGIAPSMAAALWFARTFFEPNVLRGWPDRMLRALAAAVIVTGLLHAAAPPFMMPVTTHLHGVTFVGLLLMTGPILWRSWTRRSEYRWMFPLIWAAPVMLALMRVANSFQLLASLFAVRDMMLIVMTVQALLSSLAIAYRVHLLARERDDARAQEIAARMLAGTDPLTGLLNRRAFLDQAIGRPGEQLLLIIDADHFKQINETIGHDGGDEVLRTIARVLRSAAPDGALVARIGGEEFAIVADSHADVSAAAVLNRLRAVRMPYDVTVTASIGGCRGPLLREADWKRLYRCADQALFAAKAAGRDRARDAEPSPLAA